MKSIPYITILLFFVALISVFSTINHNAAFAQYQQFNNSTPDLSGTWTGTIPTGNVRLQINQNHNNFTWMQQYLGQGLSASGVGSVNGRLLHIGTALPGRMAPSIGQIIDTDNSGNATIIKINDTLFTRAD